MMTPKRQIILELYQKGFNDKEIAAQLNITYQRVSQQLLALKIHRNTTKGTKTCLTCGKTYQTYNKPQRFCSSRCMRFPERKQLLCKHGHALCGDNLYISPNGKTRCRTCLAVNNKKAYLKKKIRI